MTENNEAGLMMTLAALAATAAAERPSGETQERRESRMMNGINAQLVTLLPGWEAVWAALSKDGANFAYIASNATENTIAVVIRGTIFTPIDLLEDLEVGKLVQFTSVPQRFMTEPLLVSQGAMLAFTETMSMVSVAQQTTLVAALQALAAPTTLYVTGHSLGGCIASMVALYVATNIGDLFGNATPGVVAYTFAAPTAGLQAFADCYDKNVTNGKRNRAWRYYNKHDLVPTAWETLADVGKDFFPKKPGPTANKVVLGLISTIAESTGGNAYVQTNQLATGTTKKLDDYSVYDQAATCETVGDFLAQAAFQHQNDTYLQLLGLDPLPAMSPVVTGLSVNYGSAGGAAQITVTGANFRRDNSEVDFGTMALPAESVTWQKETELLVTIPSSGLGVVDVRVTTIFGTSPVTIADQFAWLPPGWPLPPTIEAVGAVVNTGLLPNGGPANTPVTITGTGFVSGSIVAFGDILAAATAESLTELETTAPTGPDAVGTVPVTVINPVTRQSSVPNEQSQYTYGAPVVTLLQPCCVTEFGAHDPNPPQVVITGSGFGTTNPAVTFGGVAGVVLSEPSDSSVTVVPPPVGVTKQKTVPVVVIAGGVPSGVWAQTMFTYATKY
jgi:Lipase (class 3)/IPT/TIG domain